MSRKEAGLEEITGSKGEGKEEQKRGVEGNAEKNRQQRRLAGCTKILSGWSVELRSSSSLVLWDPIHGLMKSGEEEERALT